MCGSHWARYYRYGDPLHSPRRSFHDITGQRFGHLVADHRDANRGGRWWCACDCGVFSLVLYGSLNAGTTRTCGIHARHPAPDVTYQGAHSRVVAVRGEASRYKCIDCARRAQQWSYDRRDTQGERASRFGPYSPAPDHYAPRCTACHKSYDLGMLRRARLDIGGQLAFALVDDYAPPRIGDDPSPRVELYRGESRPRRFPPSIRQDRPIS